MRNLFALAAAAKRDPDRAGGFRIVQLLDEAVLPDDVGKSVVAGIPDRTGGTGLVTIQQIAEQRLGVGELSRHRYSAATRLSSASDIRSGSIARSSCRARSFNWTTLARALSPIRSTSTTVSMCSRTAMRFSLGAAMMICSPSF